MIRSTQVFSISVIQTTPVTMASTAASVADMQDKSRDDHADGGRQVDTGVVLASETAGCRRSEGEL